MGFRPFVLRLAQGQNLNGWVLNDASGVTLEVQGTTPQLESFERSLATSLPPLARIETCQTVDIDPVQGQREFTIRRSQSVAESHAAVTVDAALCPDCLAELFHSRNRRHRHPFINCTNCGPRFTIVRDIPYDRPNTTMAEFEMCPACRAEYRNTADRRLHAQPVCCPNCGPTLRLLSPTGKRLRGNPITQAARMLALGKILAIKGIGGFHLAVRADHLESVARLRQLKQRDSKPFALMAADLPAARRLVQLSPAGETALLSTAAPIVLALRHSRTEPQMAPAVAPGTDLLGVMLPYTPLHHLLFNTLAQHCRPDAAPALVMTSGNVCSEPLAIDNEDALQRLAPLCNALLLHNRSIERCVDDSVLLDRGDNNPVMPVRRSRGFAPGSWTIPSHFASHPTGICVGGELKNTLALVRGRDVILSQHLGDLSHPLAYQHFQKAVDDLTRLFDLRIQFVAHDLHPTYMSTHFAQDLAARHAARLIPIQHHAAHAYAVIGEHRVHEALALVCDGTGYGTDHTIWGGELLHLAGPTWKRIGHLRPFRLPGGDAAALDPRRCALALLQMAFGENFPDLDAARRLYPDTHERQTLAHMIRRGVNSPWTTSTGRLFDGIAALLGICDRNGHEVQAATALEAAARQPPGSHPFTNDNLFGLHHADGGCELDLAPFIRRLVETTSPNIPQLAAEFHQTLAHGFIAMIDAAQDDNLPLALSGGTFCNQILTRHLAQGTAARGRRLLLPTLYPPTDGGLSFGQAIYVLHANSQVAA